MTFRDEMRQRLEEIYRDLMDFVQQHPEHPYLDKIEAKLRAVEAALAGEELDEDDKRELAEDLTDEDLEG